jgi:GAF domain-containing protein
MQGSRSREVVRVARGELLARTFVELADTLVDDYDIVGFLHGLAERCVDIFDVEEAGLMLADQRGGLRVMASSSERMRLLELLELQSEEGPCFDCYRTGEPVTEEHLDQGRWPSFGPAALQAGFVSVYALPLRLRNECIGALNLFHSAPGALRERDMVAVQALADVATIGILHERSIREAQMLTEQLQTALHTRVVIEQAKGVLAERAHVDVDEAFRRLRNHARAHNRRLGDVAGEVLTGTLSADDLTRRASPARPESG